MTTIASATREYDVSLTINASVSSIENQFLQVFQFAGLTNDKDHTTAAAFSVDVRA
jgi:hypothetical protein